MQLCHNTRNLIIVNFLDHYSGQSSEGTSGNGNDDGDGGDKKDDGAEVVIEDKAGAKVDPSLGPLPRWLSQMCFLRCLFYQFIEIQSFHDLLR